MSHYENYNNTAKNYDKTRLPIGVDIIKETFEQSDTPLEKQVILDAGCGTGNYTLALDLVRVLTILVPWRTILVRLLTIPVRLSTFSV